MRGVHTHTWHDISKMPKVVKKDWFAVYYYPATEKKWRNDYVLREEITTDCHMGSRIKTKFMLCKKPHLTEN